MNTTYIVKFLLILLISISSCDKEEDQNLYYWDQTKCSDPWNTGQNDNNTETTIALRQYFENLNITLLEISFENLSQNNENSCDACNCTTGIRITIDVPENDSQKVLNLGFKKIFK